MVKLLLKASLIGATLLSGLFADTISDARGALSGKTFDVNGDFIHYGDGAYDWAFITTNGSFAAKLDGLNAETGYFIWSILHTEGAEGFDSILVGDSNKVITFGNSISSTSQSANVKTALSTLANQKKSVDGYFIHYAEGAYDWAYITPDASFVAKLDGLDTNTGYFQWSILHMSSDKGFNSVSIVNSGKGIAFGSSVDSVSEEEKAQACANSGGTWMSDDQICLASNTSSSSSYSTTAGSGTLPQSDGSGASEVDTSTQAKCEAVGGEWIDEIKTCNTQG